jgi:hypothetical protein
VCAFRLDEFFCATRRSSQSGARDARSLSDALAANALDTERSMMGHLFEKCDAPSLISLSLSLCAGRHSDLLVNLHRMFFKSPRCVVGKAKMEMKYVMCVEIMGKGTLGAPPRTLCEKWSFPPNKLNLRPCPRLMWACRCLKR